MAIITAGKCNLSVEPQKGFILYDPVTLFLIWFLCQAWCLSRPDPSFCLLLWKFGILFFFSRTCVVLKVCVIIQNNAIASENIFIFRYVWRCHKAVLTTSSLAFHKSYQDISSENRMGYIRTLTNLKHGLPATDKAWNVGQWKGDNSNKDQMHVQLHL